jgi:hypothetical protein
MTVLLKQAFDMVSKLPETLQNEIAKELMMDIETESHLEERVSEHIKHLVENNLIEDARNVLSNIQPGTLTAVDNWRKVLSEPKAKVEKSATGGQTRKNALWLQNNSEKYKGKWIALKNSELMGFHESRAELYQSLKKDGKLAGAMFFRIDN